MTTLCPICRRRADPSSLPFCSLRCSEVDLGRWLTGQYVIPVHPAEEDDDGEVADLTPAHFPTRRRVDPS